MKEGKVLLRAFASLLVIVLLLPIWIALPAGAAINSCTATVNPHTVAPGSSSTFSIEITNTSSGDANFIRISAPNGNFTITDAQADGWVADYTNDSFMLEFGILPAGNVMTATAQVSAALAEAPGANWVIEIHDDDGGFYCSGDLETAIAGEAVDAIPPVISNVTYSSLSSAGITVSWTTDEPATTQAEYGTSLSYGQLSPKDTTLSLNHQVTLSQLQANTGYFLKLLSEDANANSGVSTGHTFLTPLVAEATGNTNTVATPTPAVTRTPTPRASASPVTSTPQPQVTSPAVQGSGEKVPPQIDLQTKLTSVYKEPPMIGGLASDNESVAKIEYSLDGGINWIAVDQAAGLGRSQASFSFTPKIIDDGNYVVVVRVIDASRNTVLSEKQTLVIDRLAPNIGVSTLLIGSQQVEISTENNLVAVPNISQTIILNAVGGPTQITLVATALRGSKQAQSFALTQSPQTGLWSGLLTFEKLGNYDLTVKAIDGAQNFVERSIGSVNVRESGRVIWSKNRRSVGQAEVTVYTKKNKAFWQRWDAQPFGQSNPQRTDKNGRFNFILPDGEYYISVKAAGARQFFSHQFSVTSPTIMSTQIELIPNPTLRLGGLSLQLPMLTSMKVDINKKEIKSNASTNSSNIIGKELLDMSWQDESAGGIKAVQLRGKPSVITYYSAWSPGMVSQFNALAEVQKNSFINVIPVAVFDAPSKVTALIRQQKIDLKTYFDRTGGTLSYFRVISGPTHYFVNRQGVVQQVVTGVLSKEEIETFLARH